TIVYGIVRPPTLPSGDARRGATTRTRRRGPQSRGCRGTRRDRPELLEPVGERQEVTDPGSAVPRVQGARYQGLDPHRTGRTADGSGVSRSIHFRTMVTGCGRCSARPRPRQRRGLHESTSPIRTRGGWSGPKWSRYRAESVTGKVLG